MTHPNATCKRLNQKSNLKQGYPTAAKTFLLLSDNIFLSLTIFTKIKKSVYGKSFYLCYQLFQEQKQMRNDMPWFNCWPTGIPKHIDYPKVPLQEILKKTGDAYPEKIAIAYGEQEISYSQLETLSNQFANALIKLKVEKGGRVAIFLPNIPQFIIAYFGALKAGAIVTAVSPLYREREVEYQLADSGAETIVVLDSLYPIVEKVREKTQVKHIIITGIVENSVSPK